MEKPTMQGFLNSFLGTLAAIIVIMLVACAGSMMSHKRGMMYKGMYEKSGMKMMKGEKLLEELDMTKDELKAELESGKIMKDLLEEKSESGDDSE